MVCLPYSLCEDYTPPKVKNKFWFSMGHSSKCGEKSLVFRPLFFQRERSEFHSLCHRRYGRTPALHLPYSPYTEAQIKQKRPPSATL